MALSLSSVRAAPTAAASRRRSCSTVSRSRTVAVRAAWQDVFAPIVKIFAPPQDDLPAGTNNAFTGKIKHHDSSKRPFSDGYVAGGQKYSDAAEATAAATAESPAEGEAGVMDYVGGALERVVGHNFTGDESEPAAGTGQAGWKGDIHDRKTDGFHSRRV